MKQIKRYPALFFIIFILFFTGFFCTSNAGQGPDLTLQNKPGPSPTGYRPGEENPVRNPDRLYMLKDDILCTLFGNLSSKNMMQNWDKPEKSDLKSWQNETSSVLDMPKYGDKPNKTDFSPIELAAGRITSSKKDDVVGAYYYRDGDTIKPYVFFVDNPDVNSIASNSFNNIYFNSEKVFNNYYSIDIAVGDVDRVTGPDGEFNSEVVVLFHAWNEPNVSDYLYVQILDRDLKPISHCLVNNLDYPTGANDYTRPYFSLTMGDYDDDGMCEMAIGFRTADSHGGNQEYAISTFDYNSSDKSLKSIDTFIYSLDSPAQYNAVDLSSGDYNGDGIEDIAVCVSSFREVLVDYGMRNWTPYLLIFSTDTKLKLTKKGHWSSSYNPHEQFGSVRGSSITSGLFKYNPSGDFTTSRRQIAMANISCSPNETFSNNVIIFTVNDKYKPEIAYNMSSRQRNFTYKNDNSAMPQISAGNFKGIDVDKISDQIAFAWSENKHPKFAIYDVAYDVAEGLTLTEKYKGHFKPGQTLASDQEWVSVPIVAADKDGNGYYLGAPIHLVIPSMLRANYIIQEPPKHLDYLPDENGKWEIVQISRERNFYSSFTDKNSITFTTTHEDSTNFSIGGSENVTAKETLTGDALVEKAGITTTQSEKLSYDYNSVTSKLNGSYSSTTSQCEYQTNRDDYVQLQFKIIDIWRFPIYGLKDKKKLNGFYDVVMPGPVKEKLDGWGCDLSDYYQPAHENGNVLSYPQTSDENFPEDMGSYTVTDDNGNTHDLDSAMTEFNEQIWGQGNGTTGISWEETSWTVKERSHTKKLNFSADFQLGFQAKSYEILAKQKWYMNIDLSFHTNKSWSTTDYSKNTMSTSEGVSLFNPNDGDSDMAYVFKPIVYSTKDGTLKMAHAVDLGSFAKGKWWTTHYHGQPDPALNLPKKFKWTRSPINQNNYGTWALARYRQDRSRMRCLYLTHNEPKSSDTDKLFVATTPTAGDIIYVSTKVYNYSLDTATGDFKVRFSYTDYNPNLCNDEPVLTTIGEASVVSMEPLEKRDVYVKWDTEGLGGNVPGTGKNYVIYVTVDPYNEVKNEIHELYAEDQSPAPPGSCPTSTSLPPLSSKDTKKVFCGSNNQGYWPWSNSFKINSKKPGGKNTKVTRDLSIKSESLEIRNTGGSEDYGNIIYTDVPYRIKLKIVASETDDRYRDVFFYDNDRSFAVKRSLGLNTGENDFYCEWTPEKAGEHMITVKITEDEDDRQPGNNTTTLKLDVKEFGSEPEENGDTGSSEKSG